MYTKTSSHTDTTCLVKINTKTFRTHKLLINWKACVSEWMGKKPKWKKSHIINHRNGSASFIWPFSISSSLYATHTRSNSNRMEIRSAIPSSDGWSLHTVSYKISINNSFNDRNTFFTSIPGRSNILQKRCRAKGVFSLYSILLTWRGKLINK